LIQNIVDEAPIDEDQVPALQGRHADDDVAPTLDDHSPAVHSEQVADPRDDHVPTLQGIHEANDDDEGSDHVPALHAVHVEVLASK